MANREHLAPDTFYHLYNRGTDKRKIFSSKTDYDRFIILLYLCNSKKQIHISELLPRGSTSGISGNLWERLKEFEREEQLVDICAYCLMPNHIHLLVRERSDGNISRFIQKLMTGYTMYFNKRYDRSGALFQGKFKSIRADEDTYLKYLIAYIHLNPIKLLEPKWREIGIQNRKNIDLFLDQYRYSSYKDFCQEKRPEKVILTTGALPMYFESPSDFKNEIADWIQLEPE